MDVMNEKINNFIKKNKKVLYIGIILLVITISCIFWASYISTTIEEPIHMNDLYNVDDNVSRNSYVYTLVEPYRFAKDDYRKYYLIMDENNYLYIVSLTDEKYEEVIELLTNEDFVLLSGSTSLITEDVKEIAIEVYNEIQDKQILTNSNFEDYFGQVYLEVDADYHDYILPIIIGIISGTLSIIFIIIGISKIVTTKKSLKNIKEDDLYKLSNELNSPILETKNYILTDNYILFNSNGLIIQSYKDITWIYPYVYYYQGIRYDSLVYYTKYSKKKNRVMLKTSIKKNNLVDEIINIVKEKNPKVLVGNTKENKNLYKQGVY